MRSNRSGGHRTRGPPSSNRSAVISGSNYIGSASGRKKRKMRARRITTKPITKDFRKKVIKVMENKEVTGKYRKTHLDHLWYGNELYPRVGVAIPGATYEGKQRVEYLSTKIASVFDNVGVMDVAGILFKYKQPVEEHSLNTVYDFNFKTAKIHAKNLTCKVHLTNNSQRVYIIKLYTIANKHDSTDLEPRGEWDVLTSQMAPVSGNIGLPNVTATDIYTMGSSPTIYKSWLQNYKYEIKKIRLMPGQTYDHFIQGPQNVTYDFSKYWDGDAFVYRTKEQRWLMVTYHADLLSTTSNGAAIPGTVGYPVEVNTVNPDIFDGKGVLVEITPSWHLGMPEQTGFIYPAQTTQGLPQDNMFRRDVFGMNNYFEKLTGDVIRVDNEQPADEYNPNA